MALFFSFITAMFVTMLLIPPLMRSAKRWQFVDLPNDRKVHAAAIPRIGGIAIVAGAVLPMLIWLSPGPQLVSLLAGMGVIFLFGIWDDRADLDYRLKFMGQTLAVLIVVLYGDVVITTIPFFEGMAIPWYVAYPVTILFLLGITNAINLADGLDGLAGGTTLLSLGAIALLAYLEENVDLLLVSVALLGSVLGFLRFNTHPARVFMGDGGSQFLGFSIGVLSLLLTQHEGAPISCALPLLLLGLPILDTALVMVQRLREGRSPFSPDKNHIHHRLLALGFSHYEAVFAIYVTQSALVLAAYTMRYESDAAILVTYIGFSALVILAFYVAERSGWKVQRPSSGSPQSAVRGALMWLRADTETKMAASASLLATLMIAVYFAVVISSAQTVSMDIGLLAALLCLVQLIGWVSAEQRPFNLSERASLYTLGAVVAYLSSSSLAVPMPGLEELLFFAALALVVLIGFRFSSDRALTLNTLDFLVIFAVLTVPSLPDTILAVGNISEFLIKLVVLFYAIELLLNRVAQSWHWHAMRALTVLATGWLGYRGLLG